MGKYADEIKRLTLDPGARRLGEIADQLAADIARCGCNSVPLQPAAPVVPPADEAAPPAK